MTIGSLVTGVQTCARPICEGPEVANPPHAGEGVERQHAELPQRPGAGRAEVDDVGVPREELRAPAVPHDGDLGLAVGGRLGVVEHALAVALEPPPGVLVLQLDAGIGPGAHRSEEHTSELQSLMRLSYPA